MKTIEQRATAYAAGLSRTPGYDPAIRLAYIKGAEDALKSQWRSVDDELPEDGEKCVIMDKDGRVRAAVYDAETKHWDMDMGNTTYRYQAKTTLCWMPIPGYQGKEDGNG